MYLADNHCRIDRVAGGRRDHASATPAPTRATARPLRVVRTSVEVHAFDAPCAFVLTPSASLVHLIIPLAGSIRATGKSHRHTVSHGEALLIARIDAVQCDGQSEARALVLQIPRAAIQVAAAHVIGMPCRLSSANFTIDCSRAGALATAVQRLRDTLSPHIAPELEGDIIAGVIRGLSAAGLTGQAFTVARSVDCATAYVRADPRQDCSDRELARIAGITCAALQRNFRECLGVPAARFVQDTRLDWALARLSGSRESRSIEQLAHAIGFSSAGIFSRAYQRRFDENPSQTRRRAILG